MGKTFTDTMQNLASYTRVFEEECDIHFLDVLKMGIVENVMSSNPLDAALERPAYARFLLSKRK